MVQRILASIRGLMHGRYGTDQLNVFLIFAYLAVYLLSIFFASGILNAIAFIVLAITLFRTLSRNPLARRAENAKFMQIAGPSIRRIHARRYQMKDRDHRYFKCPECGQQLRVPKGKGNITVNCRSCGARFQEKS